MNNFIQINIIAANATDAEIMMATLSAIDFYAFEIEGDNLIAYIKEEDFNVAVFEKLLLPGSTYKIAIISNKNWNQEWESGFKPVVIDEFVAIRASFHKPLYSVAHDLIITPKMSFGTGHHATTYLMVKEMEHINFQKKHVIDFGTGTGVLAILAEKLGALKVAAVDNDEWSIHNSLENIDANNCTRIEVNKLNQLSGLPLVDILLANINRNVLTNAAATISTLLAKGSLLLVSGFLVADEAAMEAIYNNHSFTKISRREKGEWVAMLFQRQ